MVLLTCYNYIVNGVYNPTYSWSTLGDLKRCPPKNIIDHRCTVGVVYLTSCRNIFNIIIYKHILFKNIIQVSIHLSMYLCLSIRHLSTILKKGASFVSSHPAYNLIDLGRALDIIQYHIFTCGWCICSPGGAKKSDLWKHIEKTTNILIILIPPKLLDIFCLV